MTVNCATAPGVTAVEPEWQTYAGTNVRIHRPQDDATAESAKKELHEAEQIVEALRKLLTPTEEPAKGPLEIYLVNPADTASDRPFDSTSRGNGLPPLEEGACGEAILC